MKKIKLAGLGVLVAVGLSACGDSEVTEKQVEKVESTDQTDKATPVKEAKPEAEAPKQLNKEVVDNENIKATLTSIEFVKDPDFDEEYYEVTYEVENKTDANITVQSDSVSADGKMVDESLLVMSQDIAPGKKADCVLTIQDYEGGELPEMKENFEMNLWVFNDDFSIEEQHKVSVEMK